MPKKSLSMKNLSTNSNTQYHQIGNLRGEQSNLPLSNQRVLILTTPIKLKDGTVNMEQRAIPLRVDNSQFMVTAKENKSRLVSLKQNSEVLPPVSSSSVLALPINKLNKQSTTVVKNEVGQVMGKLIPLGKFSNITPSAASKVDAAVPVSTPVAVTAGKSLKEKLSKQNIKWEGCKVMKLDREVFEASKIASENFKEVFKLKRNCSDGTEVGDKVETTVTVSKPVIKETENLNNEQLTNFTDVKSKKQVHLVLKGFKNMASVGDTGTNIKLIPLENWNKDKNLNFVKSDNNNFVNSQPKIVDVRTCAIYEIEDSNNIGFDKLDCKTNSDYKEDFNIDGILEQDPLDIDGLSNENCNKIQQSMDRSTSNAASNSNIDLELVEGFETTDGTDSNNERREYRLTRYDETGGGLEMISDLQNTEIYCPQEKEVIQRSSEIPNSDGSKIVEEIDSIVSCSHKNEQTDCTEIEINDINCADLYKRFQISTDDITFRESTMFSYICNLKKKLLQNYKTRIRKSAAAANEKKEFICLNNLSTIQKRFIKSQLRNPGRGAKKQRFIRTDMGMARDILKATGPRGYNNLRKLFSLPDIGAVARAMSKT